VDKSALLNSKNVAQRVHILQAYAHKRDMVEVLESADGKRGKTVGDCLYSMLRRLYPPALVPFVGLPANCADFEQQAGSGAD